MEKTIAHNPSRSRFEWKAADGRTAFVRYTAFEGGWDVVSTYVPAEWEGKGVASALTQRLLEYARENRLKIIPSCAFTAAWLRRHPEYRDLEVK